VLRQLPNLITAVRLVLTPVLVLTILRSQWNSALWIGIGAGITDVVDGFAARMLRVPSRVGAYLDPIADKILLSCVYLALGAAHALPWWMVALVFGRDIFILAMCLYGYWCTSIREFPPTVWGKISTLVQIVAAMVVVAERAGFRVRAAPFLWLMVATTAWSGIHYGWRALRMLKVDELRRAT
jgi:cardiolipin synthase